MDYIVHCLSYNAFEWSSIRPSLYTDWNNKFSFNNNNVISSSSSSSRNKISGTLCWIHHLYATCRHYNQQIDSYLWELQTVYKNINNNMDKQEASKRTNSFVCCIECALSVLFLSHINNANQPNNNDDDKVNVSTIMNQKRAQTHTHICVISIVGSAWNNISSAKSNQHFLLRMDTGNLDIVFLAIGSQSALFHRYSHTHYYLCNWTHLHNK